MARSLIAVTLDTDDAGFDVALTVKSVGHIADVAAEVNHIAHLRAEAAHHEHEASARAAALARQLAGQGLTVRDIGTLLGVSFQRARQLLST